MRQIIHSLGLHGSLFLNLRMLMSISTIVLLLFTGCKKEIAPTDEELLTVEAFSKTGIGHTIVVQAGQSIQDAVNMASAGWVIKLKPGTYYESIAINKPGMTIIGEGNAVIQNPGGMAKGITVLDGADNFTVRNVAIQDFAERGVDITQIENFLLSHVTAINNGEFGLFSEFCNNGVFEYCTLTGHAETGIFVGQSMNVTARHNRSYANVIGLEVENSSYVTFDKNHLYDNAVGILGLLVPGRVMKESSNLTITTNRVEENNHVNFSNPPEVESVLPSGIGILLLGTDKALVQNNTVSQHQFTGIALVSSLTIAALANLSPEAFADIEPDPDDGRIINNKVANSGYNPPPGLPLPGVDLLWDGTGNNNCWKKNLHKTSYPAPLPACR